MNMSTRMLEDDDFFSAITTRLEVQKAAALKMQMKELKAEERRRVWKVRRWLWMKAWRLVITSPMGAACLAIWAVQIAVAIAKRIGGAP